MKILESSEDYLERILMLKRIKGKAHAVDIARALDVTKASVSIALKKLRENGYITVAEDNSLDLTDSGYRIANAIFLRHQFFTDWLIALGVDAEVARRDACKLEHGLSDESFQALRRAAGDVVARAGATDDLTRY